MQLNALRLKCCHEMRFESFKCVCGWSSAPDPAGVTALPRPLAGLAGFFEKGVGTGNRGKERGGVWEEFASWR